MGLLERNWLSSPPHDYELKKYKLLDAIQYIVKMVDDGKLLTALDEVEERLYNLYKFHGEKALTEDRLKILKGINLDTMDLEYEYPEQLGEMSAMFDMAEFAIDEFETVFKLIRATWRKYSKQINITEVPERRVGRGAGFVFVIQKDSDANILVYQYNPIVSNTDWKTMELIPVGELKKSETEIHNFIQSIEENRSFRFWRIDHSMEPLNFDQGPLHIIRYNLFYKIVVQ